MKKTPFQEWLEITEGTISRTISACAPRAWNEDYISYSWLRAVRNNISAVILMDLSTPWSLSWDAFKADGPLEEENGDIAFLVRLTFKNGRSTTGAAFLEAKRIYGNGRYQKLRWEQLRYQASKSANHRLLLYDDKPMTASTKNLLGQAVCRACFPQPFTDVRAAVIPTQHALAFRERSRGLAAASIPLSYQICCRFLRGFDLDYSEDLVEAVRNGVVDGIKYLVVAHAVQGVEGEPSVRALEFNRDVFRNLDPHNEER